MNARSDNGDCHSCSSAKRVAASSPKAPYNTRGIFAANDTREGVASWA